MSGSSSESMRSTAKRCPSQGDSTATPRRRRVAWTRTALVPRRRVGWGVGFMAGSNRRVAQVAEAETWTRCVGSLAGGPGAACWLRRGSCTAPGRPRLRWAGSWDRIASDRRKRRSPAGPGLSRCCVDARYALRRACCGVLLRIVSTTGESAAAQATEGTALSRIERDERRCTILY